MTDLPQKKVGIIACSGEEIAEGTVTRLAARQVLETLRPGDTVTICLPLFLAGGEGDRAFAKFYPTIAVDGCEKRCAYRGTAQYSNTPAASVVISDLVAAEHLPQPEGRRKLSAGSMPTVEAAARLIAGQVDELLGKTWDRTEGAFDKGQPEAGTVATCSCGSGIPVLKLTVAGREMSFIALPTLFENFKDQNKAPSDSTAAELMDMVKIYNPVEPAEEVDIRRAVMQAYHAYWVRQE